MHDTDSMLLAQLDKFLALLSTEAEVFRTICSPSWIHPPSDESPLYKPVNFLAYFANTPSIRHLFCDLLCLGIPENVTSLYFFFGLVFALTSDTKEQVIECGGAASILAKTHKAWADDGDKLIAHASPSPIYRFHGKSDGKVGRVPLSPRLPRSLAARRYDVERLAGH